MFFEFMEVKKYRYVQIYLKSSMRHLSTLYVETQKKLADVSHHIHIFTLMALAL